MPASTMISTPYASLRQPVDQHFAESVIAMNRQGTDGGCAPLWHLERPASTAAHRPVTSSTSNTAEQRRGEAACCDPQFRDLDAGALPLHCSFT